MPDKQPVVNPLRKIIENIRALYRFLLQQCLLFSV